MLGSDPSIPFPSCADLQKGMGQAPPHSCLCVMTLFQVVEVILPDVFCCKHCFWKVFWKDAAFLAPKGRGNNSCCFCLGMSQTPLETTECKAIYKLLLNLPMPTTVGTSPCVGTLELGIFTRA